MDYTKLIEMLKEWAKDEYKTTMGHNPLCVAQADGINMAKQALKFKIEQFELYNS